MAELARLGKYEVTGRLPQAGTAEVLRARLVGEGGFERAVAIRRLPADAADAAAAARQFTDEARVAARLRHGNILQTLELGRAAAALYVVVELVEGLDAASFAAGCAALGLAPHIPLACFVVAEACRALAAAHDTRDDRGLPTPVAHGDLRPRHVLLSTGGEVKLAGFGAAQARSPGAALDRRADIAAAGALLYELLTFQAVPGDARRLAPRAGAVNARVGPSLEAVVQRCLAPDPAARFQDARAVEAALLRYLHGEAGGFGGRDLADYLREHFPHLAAAAGSGASVFTDEVHAPGTLPAATPMPRRARGPQPPPDEDAEPVRTALLRRRGPGVEPDHTQVTGAAVVPHGDASGTDLMPVPTVMLPGRPGLAWAAAPGEDGDEDDGGTFATSGDGEAARRPARSVASAAADLWGDEADPPVTQPVQPALPQPVPENLEDDSWSYGEEIPLDLGDDEDAQDVPMDSVAEIRVDDVTRRPAGRAPFVSTPARTQDPFAAAGTSTPLRMVRLGGRDGRLLVAAPPDARVSVDGADVGPGKVLLEGLDRDGRYQVQVAAPGFQPWRSTVTLGGKATGVVRVNLAPRR